MCEGVCGFPALPLRDVSDGSTRRRAYAGHMIFERIVCGIDGSPESAEAVRQADLLMARGGHLLLVGAADVAVAVHAGFQAAGIADSIETETRDAILRAEKSVAYGHQAHPRLLKGPAGQLPHQRRA